MKNPTPIFSKRLHQNSPQITTSVRVIFIERIREYVDRFPAKNRKVSVDKMRRKRISICSIFIVNNSSVDVPPTLSPLTTNNEKIGSYKKH